MQQSYEKMFGVAATLLSLGRCGDSQMIHTHNGEQIQHFVVFQLSLHIGRGGAAFTTRTPSKPFIIQQNKTI
jgi:hypothetical protein